jgi:putative acetyltransferase
VTFLIARINGKPVGCGAFMNHGKYAEIKRMFVLPGLRGMGIGRRIMDELETRARLDGLIISMLETGVSQPAALKLYAHCGYLRRGPFPPYSNDPQSVFMEKKLTCAE